MGSRGWSVRGLCVSDKFNAYPIRHTEGVEVLKPWQKMVIFLLY